MKAPRTRRGSKDILGGVFVLHQFEVGRLSPSFIGEKNVPRGAGILNHQTYLFSILHHQHCLWKFHSGMASSLGPSCMGPKWREKPVARRQPVLGNQDVYRNEPYIIYLAKKKEFTNMDFPEIRDFSSSATFWGEVL